MPAASTYMERFAVEEAHYASVEVPGAKGVDAPKPVPANERRRMTMVSYASTGSVGQGVLRCFVAVHALLVSLLSGVWNSPMLIFHPCKSFTQEQWSTLGSGADTGASTKPSSVGAPI